jgi:cold shock CspA family protein
VHWEYTDGGDDGWIDLYIHPSDIQFAQYLHLELGENHCYRIVPDPGDPSFSSTVEDADCPFDT